MFPVLLGTLFGFAFGGINKALLESDTIKAAVVLENPQSLFVSVLESLESGEDAVLENIYTDANSARQLLEKGEVSGIFFVDEDVSMEFAGTGPYESALKSIADEYMQTNAAIALVMENTPEKLPEFLKSITAHSTGVERVSYSKIETDIFVQYFYALIAMACIYAGFFGVENGISLQANSSVIGLRRSISPCKKINLVISDLCASLTISFIEICITLAYLRFAFNISFGSVWAVMLVCFLGCIAGLELGMFIALVFPGKATTKQGVFIGAAMGLSALAGLMFHSLRHIIERFAPVINRLNPASLIVDSFYKLSTYGVQSGYWQNIAWLGSGCFIGLVACILFLRRKSYASV